MKKSSLLIGAIYALFTFLVTAYFFNFVFDDSYDAFASSMSSFQFTDFSLFDQHYLGILVVRDFLKFIQELLPNLNIFATSYIFFNVLSLVYLAYTIFTKVIIYKYNQIKHLIVLSLLLISIESLVSITHTRFATIITGLALINLIYGKQSKKNMFLHFSFFLFGFLIRPESGIGAILFIGLAHLIFRFNINRFIKGIFFPALSVIILILTFNIHKKFTNRFEILIEPDIEYALSTKRLAPMESMKTPLDSLRYEMATTGMFIDTSFVSVEYLKSIVVNEQFDIKILEVIDSMFNVFSYSFSYIFYTSFLFFILFLLIKKKLFVQAFQLLLYNMCVFIVLTYVDYNVNLAERHFHPLKLLSVLMSLFFVFKHKIVVKNNSFYFILLMTSLMSISLYYSVKNSLEDQTRVFKDVLCYEDAMKSIESKYSNQTMVVTLSSFHLLDRKYTFYNNNYKANRYLMYDISNYSIVPRNLEYLSKVCSCNSENPVEFFKWAAKNNILFLIDENRAELMEKYMMLVHQKEISFETHISYNQVEIPNCFEKSIYNNFEIKYISMN